ncbi:MAG TPA: hypothetical protein VE549_17060, partial [Myxococcaceae bacterium]|nr:hypothetical protein [Myxococcaceae bacterium]
MKAIAALAAITAATAAYAAVTFDPETGTGFVGKGDVQLALGYNNALLQQNADTLVFEVERTVVTEVSWECTNDRNERIQERSRTTTTEIQAVLSSVARERNQITGFFLTGYDGEPTVTSTTDGPPVNSCPAGPWSLTTPAGDPVVVFESTVLTVNTVPLPITPVL